MWYVIPNDELYHHGILGQKWGVRRFQNPDGSLTAEGRKRYGVDIEKSKSNYEAAKSKYTIIRKTGTKAEKRNSALDKKYAQQDLKNEKIKEKLNNRKKISKHEQNLIEKYKVKGMNDEEAAIAAYQRVRTEKVLAAVGGVAVASLAAYGLYKYHDTQVDKIIQAGTQLDRVEVGNYKGVRDAFYASRGKKDAAKCAGMYAEQILNNKGHLTTIYDNNGIPLGFKNKGIYQKRIIANDTIKIASDNSGKNILKKFYSLDQTNKDTVNNAIKFFKDNSDPVFTPKIAKAATKAEASLKKGVIDKNVYDLFNAGLPLMDRNESNKFYKLLRDAGYDAIMDVNDRKFSGYNSKSAAIYINKAKVFVESVKELDRDKIPKNAEAVRKQLMTSALLKKKLKDYGITAGEAAGSYAVFKAISNKQKDKIVSEYRSKHPNTKLSYNEIIRNYERSRLNEKSG